jgi:2-methylcitrate dehydratase PrpD
MTIARDLSEWASQLEFEDLPSQVVRAVQDRLLDTLGVAVAGASSDAGRIVRRRVLTWGGPGNAGLLGEDLRLPAPTAALVNGTYSHALDFDDTHLPSIVHPSAPLVPAVLAQANGTNASGRALLTALTIGYEISCRLGMAQYDPVKRRSVFIDRGLHVTSYVGAIAGAAAGAKLAGLDRDGIAHAISIATGMGAGLIESSRSGGSVKKFQGGWSAHCAVVAAEMAADGLTGAATALEGRYGFFKALCGDAEHNLGAVTLGLGDHWYAPTIAVKPYPCSHFNHALVDAALELRGQGVRPEEVESATLGVATTTVAAIGEPLEQKQRPSTPYFAQFSGPYIFASALAGGGGLGVAMSDFKDAAIHDPVRLRLASVCTVTGDSECDAMFPEQFPAHVQVRLRSGSKVDIRVMTNRGGADRPLTAEELRVKLEATAGVSAGAIVAAVDALPETSETFSLHRATFSCSVNLDQTDGSTGWGR